jgi:HAD superfamily hydrolase (TIGR01509 family)
MKIRTDADALPLTTRKYWIFDLDGTLTVPVHDFEFIRRELDIPVSADILGHLDTLSNAEAVRRYSRLQEIEWELACSAVPAQGAVEAIARLHRSDAKLGILTRNDKDIALKTLETIGMGSYFFESNVLGRHEAPPKPDPAGIHILLSGWKAEPSEAVMVGDYLFDLQAGRAAGTATVHVWRPDGKTWPQFTDISVTSLEDLSVHFG